MTEEQPSSDWRQIDGAPAGWQFRRVGARVDMRNTNARPWHSEPPRVYLSRAEFAERIGVKPATMGRYKLPEPDAMTGKTRGWLPETVDAWNSARPKWNAKDAEVGTVMARDLKAGMSILVDDTIRTIDLVIDEGNDIYVHYEDRLIDYFTPKQRIKVANKETP